MDDLRACVFWRNNQSSKSSKRSSDRQINTDTDSAMASVFVRNLPYGITQEELEQVFGDIGPVKKVDVIKDKGKKKADMLTRGFAFVR